MPRYMEEPQIVNGNGSGTNVLLGDSINFRLSYGYSIQFNITGTSPVGTGTVQGSNDGVNWTNISTIAISGVNSYFDNKDAVYYAEIRAKYAGTSGTGVSVNAYLVTKGG